ncbi:hypothetical protein Taro_055602 [Colocasia esculenta]|uniref:NAC domain-containing protein n=1 Tax=Colocasia esculenta TaxID=4460 RepID=A0A843XRU9_COLES|nr:hypothetical protein [Colocasia esculenta]
MEMNWSELDLPGFRFHPTEEELLDFYLKGAVRGKKLQPEIIHTLNIYLYHPLELPGMARNIGEREWYFFVPRDRRSNNGGRPNRTTDKGFWKATGSDRTIRSVSDPKRKIGLKKTLVFYEGRAPRGTRTDWVMNEYRLPDADNTATVANTCASTPKVCLPLHAYLFEAMHEDIVLCKIYRKATSMKELEQRAAMNKDATAAQCGSNSMADNTSASFSSSSDQKTSLHKSSTLPLMGMDAEAKEMKVETETEKDAEVTSLAVVGSEVPPRTMLPELHMLQVPQRQGFDWAHDPFLAQLRSPWLDNWSPLYANILNF